MIILNVQKKHSSSFQGHLYQVAKVLWDSVLVPEQELKNLPLCLMFWWCWPLSQLLALFCYVVHCNLPSVDYCKYHQDYRELYSIMVTLLFQSLGSFEVSWLLSRSSGYLKLSFNIIIQIWWNFYKIKIKLCLEHKLKRINGPVLSALQSDRTNFRLWSIFKKLHESAVFLKSSIS